MARRIAARASTVYHAARTWDSGAVNASTTAAAQPGEAQQAGNVVRSSMVQRLHPDGTASFEVMPFSSQQLLFEVMPSSSQLLPVEVMPFSSQQLPLLPLPALHDNSRLVMHWCRTAHVAAPWMP